MQFSQGHLLVHPHHGPATVTGTTVRSIRGVPRRYIDLQIHRNDLAVSVPEDAAEEIGLRELYGTEQLDLLIGVLQALAG